MRFRRCGSDGVTRMVASGGPTTGGAEDGATRHEDEAADSRSTERVPRFSAPSRVFDWMETS